MEAIKSVYDNPFSRGKENRKDWAVILEELTYENASIKKLESLKSAAVDWNFCACGNLCEAIPRKIGGKPKDNMLRLYGDGFYELIDHLLFCYIRESKKRFNYYLKEARENHDKIEARATEILIKMGILKQQ